MVLCGLVLHVVDGDICPMADACMVVCGDVCLY